MPNIWKHEKMFQTTNQIYYCKYKHRAYAENQDRYINQPIYGKIRFIFKPEPIIYL